MEFDKNIDRKLYILREQRIVEATKKNLMGSSGRLAMIVRYLGQPMIAGDYAENYESDGQSFDIAIANDVDTYTFGWYFYGIDRGIDISITYLFEDKKIVCHYKGNVVYEEEAGELVRYCPSGEWEGHIDKLHSWAKEKDKIRQEERKGEDEKKSQKLLSDIRSWVKSHWGI